MWRGETLNAGLKKLYMCSFRVNFFKNTAGIYNSGWYVGVIWVLLCRQHKKGRIYLQDLSFRDVWKVLGGKGAHSSLVLCHSGASACGAGRTDLSAEQSLSFQKIWNTKCLMDILGSLLLPGGKIKVEINFKIKIAYIYRAANEYVNLGVSVRHNSEAQTYIIVL